MTSGRSRTRQARITASDARAAAWSLVATTAGIGIAVLLVPGTTASSLWSVLLVAVVVAVADVLLRPILRLVAVRLGALGAFFAGVGTQVVIAWLALTYVPGMYSRSWTDAVVVLIIAGVVMALGRWIVGAGDYEYVLGDVLRRARRAARRRWQRTGDADSPNGVGLLIVQLDGVSRQALQYALQAGLAPTMARWLREGSHRLESWWAQVPSTTPASQAGILHRAADRIPAFRWWDRSLGRLVVTNHPADAALIEEEMSDGHGLLAGGGVAVSTMFSGDAESCVLVMSRARQGIGPGKVFVDFFSSPFVLVRAVVGTVGEYVKELYQGWQQSARKVWPRVSRLGYYPLLRAVSNAILRQLNISVVAERLVAGAPIIFVDLVDYDEIAHHAGPLRPESMRALEGLDRVIGLWEEVAKDSRREYRIVVLSDHGQSLGETFQDATGHSLSSEVRRLMSLPQNGEQADSESTVDGETWGSVNTALNAFSRPQGKSRTMVGPDRKETSERIPRDQPPEVVVTGSGNLAMVWFPRHDGPLSRSDIDIAWPALLPGLTANPWVGVVVFREGGHTVAQGSAGTRDLDSGEVEGADPLSRYGTQAVADLRRVVGMDNAGDLVLISDIDGVGMIHAFEGLVGSHGGLGGAQNEAVLLAPADLQVDESLCQEVDGRRILVGADDVHRQLIGWLHDLGLRQAPRQEDNGG